MPALNTGAVDGFDNTPLFTQAASWHQAITHYTVTKHIYQPALLVVNLNFSIACLQSSRRSSFLQIRPEARGRKGIRALEPLLLKNLSAQKITVTELSKEQLKIFETASRPAWKRGFKGNTGWEKLFDAIIAPKKAK